MLAAITLLLVYQLAGEILARMFALPIPGPVIGMALLFVTLLVRGGASDNLRQSAGNILQHLSLLFIPAGTGVIVYGALIREEWLALGLALVVSTLLALALTALCLRWLLGRRKTPQENPR